jgi:hypothetical protein
MYLTRLGVFLVCMATLSAGGAVAGEAPVNSGVTEAGPGVPALVEAAQGDPRGEYTPAPASGRQRARVLARGLMLAAVSGDTDFLITGAVEASELGFELIGVQADGETLAVLGDASGDGRGLLIVRFGPDARPVVLQAPHSFFDIGTGQLAAEIMARSDVRVLQVNTRHRNTVPAESGQPPPTDLAHRTDSWFHALTLGILDGLERPLLVQLHGFGRQTIEDPAVDAVASCGATDNTAVLNALAGALASGLPQLGVARYPDEISVLGGTSNVQGRALIGRTDAAFLHLELSPEARKQVLDSTEAQDALRAAIVEASATLQ